MSKICVIGDVNVDIVSLLREPLQANSDTQTSNSLNLGGSPCNMAMWLANVKAEVTFMAAVGEDLLANWITSELEIGGLSDQFIQRVPNTKSGTCIILVNENGQRTMLPDPGANLAFKLTQSVCDEILSSSVVVMSAYSFLRPETRDLANEVATLVSGTSTRLVLDAASSAPIQDVGVDLVRNYLSQADLVLANEDEFATLADEGWIKSLPNLIVKLGPEGSKWMQFGQEVFAVNAIKVDVVDTTGAGDSFLAGLVSVLADLGDWSQLAPSDFAAALSRASEVAATNVVTVGAGPI